MCPGDRSGLKTKPHGSLAVNVWSIQFLKSSILSHKNTAVRAVIFCLWLDEQGRYVTCIMSWAALFMLFIGEEWVPWVAGAEAKKVLLEKCMTVFWRKRPIQNASTAPILLHKIHIAQDVVCICITMHCVLLSNIHHTAMHCVSLSCIIMHCFVIQHTSWCTVLLSTKHYITMQCFSTEHTQSHPTQHTPTITVCNIHFHTNAALNCTIITTDYLRHPIS